MLHVSLVLAWFISNFFFLFAAQGSKSGTRKAFTESFPLRKHTASSTSSEGIEGGKSSRQLRKQSAQQLVDEPVDEAYEPPSISNTDIDEDDGEDENRENSPSQKKKAPRKCKKPLPESDKPVRKRKKANEAPDQATKVPPKKFSHSTRRNKRRGKRIFLVSKIVRFISVMNIF